MVGLMSMFQRFPFILTCDASDVRPCDPISPCRIYTIYIDVLTA